MDYRDSSRIVRLLTRDNGVVDGILRGVRSASRRRRNVPQLFQPLMCSLQGRGELLTVTQLDVLAPSLMLPPQEYLSACYLNELILSSLARNDEHRFIYESYGDTLHALAGHEGHEAPLRVFEKRLLAELGYGLTLHRDVHGAPIQNDALYRYELGRGPVPTEHNRDRVLSGAALNALAKERITAPSHLHELKLFLREALMRHVHERRSRVRDVWQQWRSLSKPTRTSRSA